MKNSMELGPRLRRSRQRRGLTLQAVADLAGLSKSFVSQVESGTSTPSLASLKRIGDALGIPLAALVDGHDPLQRGRASEDLVSSSDVRVVRRKRRKMLIWPGSHGRTQLLTPDLQRKLEVTLSVWKPGYTTGHEPYAHHGEEFGLVLEGRFEVTVGDETFVLEKGDTIYFPSHLPHKSRVIGRRPATTLWVITPPSF
jgi:transcriptional regulator with XRE-family HTH domain